MASRAIPAIVALLIVACIGAGGWYWWTHREPPYLPPTPTAPPAPPAPTGPRHPITLEPAPLPALNDSDTAVRQAGMELVGLDALARFFNIEDLVRRIVATVDNLPRGNVAARVNPVKPIDGAVLTQGRDTTLAIAPQNAARYTAFVRVVEHVDAKKAAAAYRHFYPLFQQAYEELGYPGKYFNDRLVEAIDNLLDAPEIDGAIALTVPHVLYEYRDPDLESRSTGQKALVRMGRANEAAVKAKLRELRREITAP